MQVGSPRLGLGFVEVVSEPIRSDVTAVGACDDEVRRLLAVARFFYEFSELGWNRLGRIARRRFRGLQAAVPVGGMANTEGLRF